MKQTVYSVFKHNIKWSLPKKEREKWLRRYPLQIRGSGCLSYRLTRSPEPLPNNWASIKNSNLSTISIVVNPKTNQIRTGLVKPVKFNPNIKSKSSFLLPKKCVTSKSLNYFLWNNFFLRAEKESITVWTCEFCILESPVFLEV